GDTRAHRYLPVIVILTEHSAYFRSIRPGIEVATNNPRLGETGSPVRQFADLRRSRIGGVWVEVSGKEVYVPSRDGDVGLSNRSLVAQEPRRRAIQRILREDKVAFSCAYVLRDVEVIPGAASLADHQVGQDQSEIAWNLTH